ncbi:hypothetical protein [Diatraea saccharalis granulovirus]|uniref:Uncharacterized protein n=1 Tax=Diatraea saccharalis granulovirus TaxID=1675862 RepID=A0A0R7EYU5_9BBAC|nr:hypothetical protein [Diatraea saccharalis granulovirus]AKN80733.1 hypothetical protein [Diatraea saccharalis granulovirus]
MIYYIVFLLIGGFYYIHYFRTYNIFAADSCNRPDPNNQQQFYNCFGQLMSCPEGEIFDKGSCQSSNQ